MKKIISVIILICSLIFIILGISRGEAEMVIEKAVRICMECIGLG